MPFVRLLTRIVSYRPLRFIALLQLHRYQARYLELY
nr:MAG TPA: hypothetical protein [Bacteriophage sp.]